MVFNSRPFFFRLLCLFLVFLILANALIIPAHALSLEFVGFVTRSLIASLIRACGVYVADGINNSLSEGLAAWDTLVDFLVSKIPAEYLYINAAGEKFVRMILKDGLYYADRNLVEWVIDTLTQPTMNSSGEYIQAIGYGFLDLEQWQVDQINSILSDCQKRGYEYAPYIRSRPYCCYIDFSPSTSTALYDSPLVIFSDEEVGAYYNQNTGKLRVSIYSGTSVYLYNTPGSSSIPGNGKMRTDDDVFTIEIPVNGATIMYYEGDITVQTHGGFGGSIDSVKVESETPSIDASWAASSITVTDEQVGGTVVGLPVSVPSDDSDDIAVVDKNQVIGGTQSGSGSVAIPDTNTGTDTGTETVPGVDATTQTGFWNTLLSWVKTLWQALLDILAAVKSLAISIAQPIVQAIADIIAAVKALAPDPPSFGDFQIPGLKDFFPFCIPFDLLAMMQALSASPVAPSFVFACPLPSGGVYNVNIDLSAWDGVASTVRSVIVAIYVVTLANSTRKFIKW